MVLRRWGWNYPYWGWGVPYVHYSYRGRPNPSRNFTSGGFGSGSRFGNRNTTTRNQHNTYGQRNSTRNNSRFDNNRNQNQQFNRRPDYAQPQYRNNGFGAIVEALAEAASVEAIAAEVASAVVAVAVSAAEDNKGGSPSITI